MSSESRSAMNLRISERFKFFGFAQIRPRMKASISQVPQFSGLTQKDFSLCGLFNGLALQALRPEQFDPYSFFGGFLCPLGNSA